MTGQLEPYENFFERNRCECGGKLLRLDRDYESVEITSWTDLGYRKYQPTWVNLRLECENGHIYYASKPYGSNQPQEEQPQEPIALGPAIPEVVSQQEYRQAFNEDYSDDWEDYYDE
jgi:hypothetical protein